jgi:hypothetical protein
MKRNFVKLYESTLQRYTNGGFLTGDVVVFKEGALKADWFKSLGSNTQEKIKKMVESGLNLRVSAVKNVLPNVMGAGNTDYTGTDVNVDITSEIAPGRYMDFATVPGNALASKCSYPNLPEVPEVLKKDDPARRTNIKPKKVKDEQEEVPFYSPARTRESDLGNLKMSAGDRVLNNQNVKIPSSPAVGNADPATYTAKYLPKNS